jgi:hypothetical protein
MIIVPYLPFIYLKDNNERSSFLKSCFHHLDPGGKLIFDFMSAPVEKFVLPPWLSSHWTNEFEKSTGLELVQIQSLPPDKHLVNNTLYQTTTNGVKVFVSAVYEYLITISDLNSLVKAAGFSIEAVYGDYELKPFDNHETGIIVCKK